MKIIKIKSCEECVHSYDNNFLSLNATLVCGDFRLLSDRPKIEDRIIKSKKIPKWCLLEDLK
jgi:hypothetical protein